MSDWIEKEGVQLFQERNEAERQKQLIIHSDFWSKIKGQIVSDIEQINKEPNWRPALQGSPLYIEGLDNGIRVIKSVLPAAFLNIVYKGETVEVQLQEIRKTGGSPQTLSSEKLSLVVEGDLIYLSDGTEFYVIPEQVSQHVLLKLLTFIREEFVKL